MRDADIFYKAVLALVDREMKAKVIEAAPDENHRTALRARIYQYLERIKKGDRGLH